MGLFDRFRKKKIAPQGTLTEEDVKNLAFMVHLLFKEKTPMPSLERMTQVMCKYLGAVDCCSHDEKFAAFAVKKHLVQLKEGNMPVELMVTDCLRMADFPVDEATRSQMWDCPESSRILEECQYHICAIDGMAYMLPHKDRANLDMDYLEALVELFPECEAVYFQNSGKLFAREKVAAHVFSGEDRFIHFAVNARFFNIEGTNEHIIDTLGMGLLGLPDVQYHFHDFDPNWIVYHAYNLASYICGGEKRIEDGDHIDGIKDGEIDVDIRWRCHYENSMIQPDRPVIDICMNEYAAGKRDYKRK